MLKIVNAALKAKAKAWTFEAKTKVSPEAKAWPGRLSLGHILM